MGRKPKKLPTKKLNTMREVKSKVNNWIDSAPDTKLRRGFSGLRVDIKLKDQLTRASQHSGVREVAEYLLQLKEQLADETPAPPQKLPGKKNPGGRPPSITPDKIAAGIRLIQDNPGLKLKLAYALLQRELHITATTGAMYRLIVRKAR